MSAITSVRFWQIAPQRALPKILFVVAAFCLLGGGGDPRGIIVALSFGGVGAALWFTLPYTYSVRIITASGESDAFVAKHDILVERIVRALNDAIVARG